MKSFFTVLIKIFSGISSCRADDFKGRCIDRRTSCSDNCEDRVQNQAAGFTRQRYEKREQYPHSTVHTYVRVRYGKCIHEHRRRCSSCKPVASAWCHR